MADTEEAPVMEPKARLRDFYRRARTADPSAQAALFAEALDLWREHSPATALHRDVDWHIANRAYMEAAFLMRPHYWRVASMYERETGPMRWGYTLERMVFNRGRTDYTPSRAIGDGATPALAMVVANTVALLYDKHGEA